MRTFQQIINGQKAAARRRRVAPLMRGRAYIEGRAASNPGGACCSECADKAAATTPNPSNAGLKYPFGRKLSGAQPKDLKDPFPNPQSNPPRAGFGGWGSGGTTGWGRGWGWGGGGFGGGYGWPMQYTSTLPYAYGWGGWPGQAYVVAPRVRRNRRLPRYTVVPWAGYSPFGSYGAVVAT